MPPGALTNEQMIQKSQQTPATSPTISTQPTSSAPPLGALTQQQMTQAQSGTTPATPQAGTPDIFAAAGSILKGIVGQATNVAATAPQLGTAVGSGLSMMLGKGPIADPYSQPMTGPIGNALNTVGISSNNVTPITNHLGVLAPQGFLQKAGDFASLTAQALSGGDMSALKLAGLGAISQGGQSVAQGNTIGQDLANTIFGLLFAGGLGAIGGIAKFGAEAEQIKTGVVGKIANDIAGMDPQILKDYAEGTIAHSQSSANPPPDILAEAAHNARAHILLDQIIPDLGQAVGDAKKAARTVPISVADDTGKVISSGVDAATQVISDIDSKVQSMTDHMFGSVQGNELDLNPTKGESILPVPGTYRDLKPGDLNKLNQLQGYVTAIAHNPTAGFAQDMSNNIKALLPKDYYQRALINATTPVEGAIAYAAGAIKRVVAPGAPELVAANEAFSNAKDLVAQVGTEAGKNLNSASLAERRLMSGDKWNYPYLKQLSDITQPYIKPSDIAANPALRGNLVQHATASNWAKMVYGNNDTATLLQQAFNKQLRAATGILGWPKQYVQNGIQKALSFAKPDPLEYAISVAKGKPQTMEPIARTIDSYVSSWQGNNVLSSFAKQLQSIGISATNAERAALPLVKMYMFNKLTAPQQFQPPTAVPQVNLPAGVQQPQANAASQGNNRTLSVAQPAQKAINNVTPATSGQQYSSQARQLTDFGMNMQNTKGLSLS